MAVDTLIDEHVLENQCEKAVKALLAHALKHEEQKEKTELLGGREQYVWLNITVKQMKPEKKLKPFKIPLVHPLVDPRTSPICLITKDPQREYKDLLETHDIRFISRVVGIEKLKGKFKPFEARRLLLKENGLFLADERVVPLLPGLLGSAFFKAKKQPIPVNLTRKNLKGELEAAISSTYYHQNQGTNSSVKIGTLSLTSAQTLANLKKALPAVVKHIKGGWDNIQSLQVKTSFSAALPIWSCDLGSDAGARWDGLVANAEASDGEDVSGDDDSEDEEMEVEVARYQTRATTKEGEKGAKAKGKKRAAEDEDEVEVEKPKKKVKSSTAEVKTTTEPSKSTGTQKKQKPPANVSAEPEPPLASPPALKASKKRKAATITKESEGVSTAPPKIVSPSSKPTPSAQPPASPDLPASEQPTDEAATKKKKRKHAKKPDAEPPLAETSKPPPVVSIPTPTPATAPTTEEPPAKKRRRKAKQGGADNVVPSVSAAPADLPAPPTLPTDVPQTSESAADAPKPKKRRKAKGGAAVTSDVDVTQAETTKSSASEIASSTTLLAVPSKSSETQSEAVEPQVSGASTKKKRKPRSSAIDFFENGEVAAGQATNPTVPAPNASTVSPDAPAEGVSAPAVDSEVAQNTTVASKEKKKRKRKAKDAASVDVSPVSGAIGKSTASASVAGGGQGVIEGSSNDDVTVLGNPVSDRKEERSLDTPVDGHTTKKVRGKKEKKVKSGGDPEVLIEVSSEKTQDGAAPEKDDVGGKGDEGGKGAEVDAKKKRKRNKKGGDGGGDGAEVPTVTPASVPAPLESNGPTPGEVKQKRKWTSAEKKKAKVVKGKRTGETVKEGLVGKKGL